MKKIIFSFVTVVLVCLLTACKINNTPFGYRKIRYRHEHCLDIIEYIGERRLFGEDISKITIPNQYNKKNIRYINSFRNTY